MLIDSHCHLDSFSEAELPLVLARAKAAGVDELVSIGTSMAQSRAILARVQPLDHVWCTVGVHPDYAAEEPLALAADLVQATEDPKVVGIGESGLDWFSKEPGRDAQERNFREHIRAAQQADIPLVIHARSADADIERLLTEGFETLGPFPFVMHCFASSRKLAEFAVAHGGYISFSGILTFRKSDALREIARDVPADRLLVETDSPYLAPVPVRGKRNEPANVVHTARVLAALRDLELPALGALTTTNFRRLFRKATCAS